MGEQRKALRTALLAHAAALTPVGGAAASVSTTAASASVSTTNSSSTKSTKIEDGKLRPFIDSVKEMKKWVDGPDALSSDEEKDSLAVVLACYEAALGRRGAALAALRARLAAQPPASSGAKVKIYIQIDR